MKLLCHEPFFETFAVFVVFYVLEELNILEDVDILLAFFLDKASVQVVEAASTVLFLRGVVRDVFRLAADPIRWVRLQSICVYLYVLHSHYLLFS